MAFLVCHMQKLGSGALGGIQSHNNREKESKTNPDIDYSKSDLNYSLVGCPNYRRAIKANIDELKLEKAVRKDAVLACSFVITSSQDYFKDKTPEETKAFFADTVKFFQDRYDEKNVIAAHVHMDETTPHMHLLVTPIRDGKLSAKAIFDRKELQSLQTELHAVVGHSRGLSRGKPGSDRAHLSENRFKAEKALEAVQAAEKKLNELTPRVLKAAEVEKIQGKKTLFGGLRGVSFSEFQSLKATAGRVDEADRRADAADRRADLATKNAKETIADGWKQVEDYAEKLNKARDQLEKDRAAVDAAMEKTPDKILMRRNKELREENEQLKQYFFAFKKSVRELVKELPAEIKKTLEPLKSVERFLVQSVEKVMSRDRGNDLGR